MIYQDYMLGEIKLRYMRDEISGHVSMLLLPGGMDTCFEERRDVLRHQDVAGIAWETGSLCHLALRHHSQGNGAGNTLKYGESTEALKYQSQVRTENEQQIRIVTLLEAQEGYQVEHTVSYTKGERGIEVETCFKNHTKRTVTLDMLSSFSLDNLSPFQREDAPYKMRLHRFRGGWSLEGKHTMEMVEELNLEQPWIYAFPESERYGVLGSHPVKRWFPFGCVEDMEHQVYWAAQLALNSSWQMEFSRDSDCYSLSGGIADCEFGGWWKQLKDGESFTAPKAYLSVSSKGLWEACQNLTDMFQKYVDRQPQSEQTLPIIFNEWCTTWGQPSQKEVLAIAQRLQELPVSYLVIDAGWSEKEVCDNDPQGGNGDWKCDQKKFPQGFFTLSQMLRPMGLKLGIWMEFEVTTKGSRVHSGNYDFMHLTRNGETIQTGKIRRFWDFRQPEVIAYLQKKVIDFLRENEIGYLKVDYNGSIGAGCDGAESPGEGLRAQMEAVRDFFGLIRKELPEVVIENCASGGHRLEPSMMQLTAMSSFSDAHECDEIPYIAADLHPLILPRQSQIWAVISPKLTIPKIQYRLVAAMLGRFCLSGDIIGLNQEQWQEVKKAARFYEEVSGIVKAGQSYLYRDSTDNHHHLEGAQVLVRNGKEKGLLLVYHAFDDPPKRICGKLPEGKWNVVSHIGAEYDLTMEDGKFQVCPKNPWEAFALHLML